MAAAECPQCGYELTGETGRWSENCPLDGMCCECGTSFRWTEAFERPRRQFYDRGAGLGVGNAWGLFLRTLLPWRFWRGREAGRPLRVRRLMLWIVLVPLAVLVVHLLLTMNLWWHVTRSWQTPFWPQTNGAVAELLLTPFYDSGELRRSGSVRPRPFPDRRVAAVQAGWIAGFVAAWVMLARAGAAGRARAIRGLVYGCAPLVIPLAVLSVMKGIRTFDQVGAITIDPRTLQAIGDSLRWQAPVLGVWLVAWWYAAVASADLPNPRLRGTLAAAAALVTAALVFLYSWRVWMYV